MHVSAYPECMKNCIEVNERSLKKDKYSNIRPCCFQYS